MVAARYGADSPIIRLTSNGTPASGQPPLYYEFLVTEEQMLDVVRNRGLLKDGDADPRGGFHTFRLKSNLCID